MTEDKKQPNTGALDESALKALGAELALSPEWVSKPEEKSYSHHKPPVEKKDRSKRPRNSRGYNRTSKPDSRPGEKSQGTKRPGANKPANQRRKNGGRHTQRPPEHRREFVNIPPVFVRFFPAQKGISALARKIKAGHIAYPLLEIARFAVKKPEACVARIEVNGDTDNLYLVQCSICGMAACSEPALNRHMVEQHIEDFMEKGELGEAPSGKFSCVAQCGLSGILLGPPNHHAYSARIREIHKTRYPNMSIEDYSSKIRMLHENEAIDKWKAEYAMQPTYKPANSEEKPMLRPQAESYFLDTVAPEHKQKTKQASLPTPLSLQTPDKGLRLAIERAWRKESRFPASIMVALRGAFRNMGLTLFKPDKNKKDIVVTPIKPTPLPVEHAAEPLRKLVLVLQKKPGITRDQIKEMLCPDTPSDSSQVRELLSTLTWLIERGHIVEFFNGRLYLPPQGKTPEKNDS